MDIIGTYTVEEDAERLDRIAGKLYGNEADGGVDALLAANRIAVENAFWLTRGTVLKVPTLPAPTTTLTRPWE